MSTWDADAAESRARNEAAARQQRFTAVERENRLLRIQQPAANSGPLTPRGLQMATTKRTGLMRALNAVKAQGGVDYELDKLADLAERNNARALELAAAGVDKETAKAGLLDQMAREQALDELEKALGSNNPPPLSDTPPPLPPEGEPPEGD